MLIISRNKTLGCIRLLLVFFFVLVSALILLANGSGLGEFFDNFTLLQTLLYVSWLISFLGFLAYHTLNGIRQINELGIRSRVLYFSQGLAIIVFTFTTLFGLKKQHGPLDLWHMAFVLATFLCICLLVIDFRDFFFSKWKGPISSGS
jgi:succinate dehydrogenase/fumarate reductase cytochrome b subunit